MSKIIFILDWDDTLFPTTWFGEHNISSFLASSNIENESVKKLLDDLDTRVFNFFIDLQKFGHITIVSNANNDWLARTIGFLPMTVKFVLQYVDVMSTHSLSGLGIPNTFLKTFAFEDMIRKYNDYTQIISMGDSIYEYMALVDMFKKMKCQNKLFKHIRFVDSPDYHTLAEQIDLVRELLSDICKNKRNLDLNFELRKF